MNKLKRAIAYFEGAIREIDEIMSGCPAARQAELTAQRQHFWVALMVLSAVCEKAKEA